MTRLALRQFGIAACLIGLLGVLLSASSLAIAQQPSFDEENIESVIIQADTASLHNPTFDNHDWYEFNERYGNYLPGSWLPDDDNNTKDSVPLSSRQDWRLWYKQGTNVLEFDPEEVYAQNDEAVQVRAYGSVWNTGHHLGGLYQVIYNTTPCLNYEFKVHSQARFEPPEHDYITPPAEWVNSMRVGIDPTGWALPTDDPAVHDNFPSSTIWGTSQKYQWAYGQLSVVAEALANKITVFTYADTSGGRSSRVLWDTASFNEVTPEQIYNPELYAPTSYIGNPQYSNSIVTWSTVYPGISQVYYRVKTATTPPTATLSHTLYLPLVAGGSSWRTTTLNKTPQNYHVATLTGLQSGLTYEYFAVTKGVFGSACTTWVSPKNEFTVP